MIQRPKQSRLTIPNSPIHIPYTNPIMQPSSKRRYSIDIPQINNNENTKNNQMALLLFESFNNAKDNNSMLSELEQIFRTCGGANSSNVSGVAIPNPKLPHDLDDNIPKEADILTISNNSTSNSGGIISNNINGNNNSTTNTSSGQAKLIQKTYFSISKIDENGQKYHEKYLSNNHALRDPNGHIISEKNQAYHNTKSNIKRIAQERFLNDQGRKVVHEKIGNDGDYTIQNYYNRLGEHEVNRFDTNWEAHAKKVGFYENFKTPAICLPNAKSHIINHNCNTLEVKSLPIENSKNRRAGLLPHQTGRKVLAGLDINTRGISNLSNEDTYHSTTIDHTTNNTADLASRKYDHSRNIQLGIKSKPSSVERSFHVL